MPAYPLLNVEFVDVYGSLTEMGIRVGVAAVVVSIWDS
jgi:hypothetical protein